MGGPALQIVDNQGIFLADLFGFLLSLPVALFLAFWISNVKRPMLVVIGAFIGSFIVFLIILGWVGSLIYFNVLPTDIPDTTFFSALPLSSSPASTFSL